MLPEGVVEGITAKRLFLALVGMPTAERIVFTFGDNLDRMKGTLMRISARNVLKGTVKNILEGAVNCEITIELPGGQEIVSIVTKSSAESLGLKVGGTAYAVVKASSVMVGVDH